MDHSQGGGSARWLPGLFVLLVILCVCWTIQADQHQVGGTPGWSLPDLAKVNYTAWASTQTFRTGDTLYFNYSSANHNVLQVTKAKYDSCDASNPTAEWTKGADIIPLNSSGTLYYLCGFPDHCAAGQKVAVEVVAATTGVRHQVGGAPGWSLPSRSNVNYTVWASNQTFAVGDTLYFNYSSQNHNVLQVTKENYDACNATDEIEEWDDGDTVIPLNTTGTFYYICGVPGHCQEGQKVAVTVGTGGSVAPAGTPPNSSPHLSHPISRLLALSLILVSVVYSMSY